MISKEEAKEKLKEGLEHSPAEQTEIMMIQGKSSVSRFANSQIHQNTNRIDDSLQVRAVVDKKIGVATTNQLTKLKKTVEKAYEAAKLSTQIADFVSLPKEGSIDAGSYRYNEKTAKFNPDDREAYIQKVVEQAKGYQAAGVFETGEATMAIANSNGLFSFQKQTEADLNTIFFGDEESSYAYAADFNADNIDPEKVGLEAFEIVEKSKNPITIEPGKYTVVLKPAAVAEMLGMLAYAGMGALAYQEKRSFMNTNIGKKIATADVDIYDDAHNKHSMGWLFDYEGVKRSKVDLIKDGVAKDVVYDSFTAQRAKHENTGHALPASSKYGPMPFNLVMDPGKTPYEELISETEKGLLINRFHYTNFENPLETTLTGMTRDGTFLIENGVVTKPVSNMRFTQSILGALNSVEAIGSEAQLASGLIGYSYVPALKIKSFNFSSSSKQ